MDNNVWERIFETPFRVTRETKLQSFQFRIIHRIIPCNKWLHNITLIANSKCNYCDKEDNLMHYFLYCPNTEIFWKCFFNWWNSLSGIVIKEILEEHIIFGYPGDGEIQTVLNFCVILAKWFIYCKKLNSKNDIDLYQYLIQLKERLHIERLLCYKNNNQHIFDKYNFIYENL